MPLGGLGTIGGPQSGEVILSSGGLSNDDDDEN